MAKADANGARESALKRSGRDLSAAPPVFERPYFSDAFIYLMLATLAFWALVLWLIWG